MPPPGQLKNNFYHAALNASKAISAHGSLSILIGSAALNAHGMASRFAKVRTYCNLSIRQCPSFHKGSGYQRIAIRRATTQNVPGACHQLNHRSKATTAVQRVRLRTRPTARREGEDRFFRPSRYRLPPAVHDQVRWHHGGQHSSPSGPEAHRVDRTATTR